MHSFITRKQTLSLTFTSTTSAAVFTITNVYAPADHRDSLAFLLDLEEVASQISGNWVLAGDFNLTRDASDNSRGGVDTRLANAFNDSIHKLGLLTSRCWTSYSLGRTAVTAPLSHGSIAFSSIMR